MYELYLFLTKITSRVDLAMPVCPCECCGRVEISG